MSLLGRIPSGVASRIVDLPGVSEVDLLCGNARRVAALCDAVGLGEPGPSEDPLDFLGSNDRPRNPLELELRKVLQPPDGAFILPPE